MTHVWFNLHRRDWSVQAGKSRVRHTRAVHLVGVRFVVREAGRQRVLARRHREVHAYASGTEMDPLFEDLSRAVTVSYNPYRGPTFYRKDTGEAVRSAAAVFFLPDGTARAINPQP